MHGLLPSRWLLAGLAILLLGVGCARPVAPVAGDGQLVEVSRDGFPLVRSIVVDSDFDVRVIVKRGAPTRVDLTIDSNLQQLVRSVVDAGALRLETAAPIVPTGGEAVLVVAALERLEAKRGRVTITGEIDVAELTLIASGDATIEVIDQHGVQRPGPVGVLVASASGRSQIDTAELWVLVANAEATDQASIRLTAQTTVRATERDRGKVQVLNQPARTLVGTSDPAFEGEASSTVRSDGLTGAPVEPPRSPARGNTDALLIIDAGTFPPLTDPRVLTAAESDLSDDALVLGAVYGGEARAYPVFMLRLHHVVNDRLGGAPYLVSF